MEAYIETRSGIKFHFLEPKADEILIEDIAFSLANQCRYNGHCSRFYSVAEHSVLVASLVPEEYRLAALLHDASEAYLSDIPSPIKQFMHEYGAMEKTVQDAINQKFDVDTHVPEVRTADLQMLCTEAHYLIPSEGKEWAILEGLDYKDGKVPMCLTPLHAFGTFMAVYERLTAKEKPKLVLVT